jgi:hypothetical protein
MAVQKVPATAVSKSARIGLVGALASAAVMPVLVADGLAAGRRQEAATLSLRTARQTATAPEPRRTRMRGDFRLETTLVSSRLVVARLSTMSTPSVLLDACRRNIGVVIYVLTLTASIALNIWLMSQ